jgi:diacylglycerol kinase (ATP)
MSPRARRASLIYNPHAGFWDWGSVINKVARYWSRLGWLVEIQPTEYAEHATELAQKAALAGYHMVLAAGGDGTLNEIANGLVGTETILAPLPVGTANSFAKELGLTRPNLLQPAFLLDVSRRLARGRIHQMDLGRCSNGRYWLLWASTGFDGFVVQQIEPRPRWFKRLGTAGYLARALFVLPQFRGVQATIQVDDVRFSGEYLLVNISNCRMFAGGELRLNSNAVLDDGLFEVWLFQGRHWPDLLSYTLDVTLENHFDHPTIRTLRGRHVVVEADPATHYHLDGEPAGVTPYSCEIVPRALRLLVPDTAPAGLFQETGLPLF